MCIRDSDIVYMPRLPKSLLTPNPKSAYGRTNIRRQFKLRGGKKERNNVLNEARKQGYSGNRLDSAYRYLADVLDVMLGFERKDYRDKKRSKDRIQSQVQQFIGKQIDDMDIGIANKDELIELINGLSPEDKVLLTVGGTVYTLNADTANRLLENVDSLFGDVEEEEYGSDAELVAKIKIVKSINVSRLKSNKSIKSGAFFHYEHNLPVNLFEDQVFKFDEFKACNVVENCLVQSLINSGVDDNTVAMVRRLCATRDIPVCKLPTICKCAKLHLSIHFIKSDDV